MATKKPSVGEIKTILLNASGRGLSRNLMRCPLPIKPKAERTITVDTTITRRFLNSTKCSVNGILVSKSTRLILF
jgi:hypothetical protein